MITENDKISLVKEFSVSTIILTLLQLQSLIAKETVRKGKPKDEHLREQGILLSELLNRGILAPYDLQLIATI